MGRRNTEEAKKLLGGQWHLYPALTVKQSTLGSGVGLGLFARKDILCSDSRAILCRFFGKIIVATEEQVRENTAPYKH
jgi:hypothetical protein